MNLHEKSLELNITHELLNLADSFDWHLSTITLWRYWEPSFTYFRMSGYKKSTAYGLHSNTEGKNDNTGEAGGGYDVKIKSGKNDSVLFIQYKRGEYSETEPTQNNDGNRSVFQGKEVNHFRFELNSTKSNQHFTLRRLSENITQQNGNSVVYAFPLIKDIEDLENNAGQIIRRTKFISITDIDSEAISQNRPFIEGQSHNYRICAEDMDRTEMNYYYYNYSGFDSSVGIICDTIVLGIRKALQNLTNSLNNFKDSDFKIKYEQILEHSISSYKLYIIDYFEVSTYYDRDGKKKIVGNDTVDYKDSLTGNRDKKIVEEVIVYLDSVSTWLKNFESHELPFYQPIHYTLDVKLDFHSKDSHEVLDNVSMIKI
ncbi:hypothetical protein [Flavobacterium sp. XS1P27]|uniref:hypothetical protein n=1 Tax=Flavobacterium sp. XS1P27 TaxID=3401724 RepID=UPI003AB0731B